VNICHRWVCSSRGWKRAVRERLLPWALAEVELGRNVLEIGPGYGATTELLQKQVDRLTCVEVDPQLAERLRHQSLGSNVTVRCEDGTAMSFPSDAFDGAVCFTMLHHVPSVTLQDRLLAEIARVLRPGGTFAGTDSRGSRAFTFFHLFDTLVVVDPLTFPERLRSAGFEDVHVDARPRVFRFRARKPLAPSACV